MYKKNTHFQNYHRGESKEKTNSLDVQSSLQFKNKSERLFEESNGLKIYIHFLSNSKV